MKYSNISSYKYESNSQPDELVVSSSSIKLVLVINDKSKCETNTIVEYDIV